MPVIDGVGQSDYTRMKEDHYACILKWHISVIRQVMSKGWAHKTYRLIDATAGPGIMNDGTPGSPVRALEILDESRLDYKAAFIESDRDTFGQLDRVIGGHDHVDLRWTQYQFVLQSLQLERYQFGLLYVDPNGRVEFPALAAFAKMAPRIDILLSLTASGIKRADKSCGQDSQTIADQIASIDKAFWLIRKPYTQHQWTFLLGSNGKPMNKPYKRIDLEPITSKDGEQWLQQISYTKKELQQMVQPSLIALMPNT